MFIYLHVSSLKILIITRGPTEFILNEKKTVPRTTWHMNIVRVDVGM